MKAAGPGDGVEAGSVGPVAGMRPGVRLGVDVGEARVGVAVSDPAGLVATPLVTLRRGEGDLDALRTFVAEREVLEVVVGLPRTLTGIEGAAAAKARKYAETLAKLVAPIGVRLVDERLTTVTAERGLREQGVGTRRGRAFVDQVAAVVILQSALDAERTSGSPPGMIVQAEE